ncbi:Inorganic phosphate transporter PHO84 [Escovopsis weberi]|uniref:Inorganic phosphate transporter PHO84 n=1 Tax=Escovopsis weberi TaxID=150374 RepID=A0A0M9VVB6_ESCWE|nr:Inorganic phosphate transporter PHO84 [Escovopsis weberi]
MLINLFTLFGSVVGQVLFGFLADRFGRTRLYGIELVLVIVSTIGLATSSFGYGDMSFLGLFVWWRFVMGIGIGAEYPLSAVITSEWSSTQSRAPMIAGVFMMQPVGQALAQIVGLLVLIGFNRSKGLQEMRCGLDNLYEEECRKAVDGLWRIVIGLGAIPALLAIIFRFFLYDCGLYSLEVKHKASVAIINTQRIYGAPSGSFVTTFPTMDSHAGMRLESSHGPSSIQFSREDLYNYFIRDGNWYYLLGTSATWFFLDVSFYSLSLDNGGALSGVWATGPPTIIDSRLQCWNSSLPGGSSLLPIWQKTGLPNWQIYDTAPCSTIYDVLVTQTKQYILTVSLASIAGSIGFILLANRLPRRQWLTISFLVLAVMFLITGGVFYGAHAQSWAPATVALVAVCHFMFNFGANTLTFIIPAEIFPTCYRSLCHGISAAAGKMGSIVAVLIGYGISTSHIGSARQGLMMFIFGPLAAVGAYFSWAYLPDVQRWVDDGQGKKYLETKTLEELGEGRVRAHHCGELVTVGEKFMYLRRRRGMPRHT